MVAPTAGLFGGLGVAAALRAITGALGEHGTAVALPLTARTAATALTVGVLVTLLAACFRPGPRPASHPSRRCAPRRRGRPPASDAHGRRPRSRCRRWGPAPPCARLDSVADLEERFSGPLRDAPDLLWALTALAVLIAFAGIANTLSLSVLERTRESALPRALGLTRGGLSAALAVEAVFVALLGAVGGLFLGVGAAWLITKVASTAAEPVLFALPWGRLGVLLGAALLMAPLAAVAPARRAAGEPLTVGMTER
ncbi:ABC transporter permease [Streptomyces sp. PTD5-9]|uniref:ABC transporter permease n=1 Tax=Streptomyces sp. PTD5-9 TaxID=3120150 RepID=UPI00300A72B9